MRGGSASKFEVAELRGCLAAAPEPRRARKRRRRWPNLFGEDSWCDCDDCQAAWGPAAYFVDLLQMIDPAHHQNTPADKLFSRRPDLQYLPLTCDNTNTPIPTIDLVNEILEINVAAAFQIPVNVRSYDSTGITADVLRAVPQNVIDAVYDAQSGPCLANQVYPFTLPFHRPLAVVRTYLDQLGATYRDVYASFGPLAPSDLTRDEHLAAEDLGLSVFQFQTIATTTHRHRARGCVRLHGRRQRHVDRPRRRPDAARTHGRQLRRSLRDLVDVLPEPGRARDAPAPAGSGAVPDRQHVAPKPDRGCLGSPPQVHSPAARDALVDPGSRSRPVRARRP